jgi:hypothetical protein
MTTLGVPSPSTEVTSPKRFEAGGFGVLHQAKSLGWRKLLAGDVKAIRMLWGMAPVCGGKREPVSRALVAADVGLRTALVSVAEWGLTSRQVGPLQARARRAEAKLT